jgi:hypothetical protein
MSEAYQVADGAIRNVLCIDADERSFQDLRDKSWMKSGLLRWSRGASERPRSEQQGDPSSQPEPASALPLSVIAGGQAAWRILLFYNPICGLPIVWEALEAAGLGDRTTVVSTVPVSVVPHRTYEGNLPNPVSPEDALKKLLAECARTRATIRWAREDDATGLAKRRFKDEDLQIVLEKYFPGWAGEATLDVVGGGLSGDPLIRVCLFDHDDEHYLKFYRSHESFVREWDGHERALDSKWLDGYAIGLCRVPSLGEKGGDQVEAFPVLPAVCCLRGAKVRTRLNELYVKANDGFVLDAYEKILEVLAREQSLVEGNETLSTTRDIGPVGENGREASLLASLRSPDQRVKVFSSLDRLRPYALSGFVTEKVWLEIQGEIRDLLHDWEPGALCYPCNVVRGRVHGDANSRNFLFNGDELTTPKDLQVVDLGGYQDVALRVFDLAQLEADLKILLMATETSARKYLDINTRRLAGWMREEKRSIDEVLLYSGPQPGAPAEVRKAYSVVRRIRKEAGQLSPGDRAGRAYLFCLLFFTLRKIGLAGVVPETKRLLACYSCYRIIEKLKTIHEA